MVDKPAVERAPIRVIEVDDPPDQLAALRVPRRYSREIDPATAARIVAAAAYGPHDRQDRRLPLRVPALRRDRPPGGVAACCDHGVAAGEAEQVICSCSARPGRHERAGRAPRDATDGGDPSP
jgi:hypothetical protein